MVAGIAYTVAQSAVFFLGQSEVAPTGVASGGAGGSSGNEAATRPPVNIQAVMERHLFGVAGATATTENVAVAAVETRLPLELQAVFVATEEATESTAIIAEKGQSGRLYRLDMDLPGGATLEEVHSDHVVLARAGTRERLTFPHLMTGLASPLDAGVPEASTFDQSIDDDAYEPMDTGTEAAPIPDVPAEFAPDASLEDYQSRLEEDPVGTLESLGVEPLATDSAQGYRVGNLAQSPQLRQTGLQPGDVIVSVNGQPVGDVDADRMELANVLAKGSARIEVQRGSRRFFVTTSLNQ